MVIERVLPVSGLDVWFAEQLQELKCSAEARAYVVGVLKALGHPVLDEHFAGRGNSVVLAYQDAVDRNDFSAYQKLGDWVLWVDAMCPASLKGHRKLVEGFGRLSYYACHRILRGQWTLYEELADGLPGIVSQVRQKFDLR